MARGGPFITTLRADWTRHFWRQQPFPVPCFNRREGPVRAAGVIDHAVPGGKARCHRRQPRDHDPPSPNDPSVIDLAVNRIVRRGAAGNIADAALVAIELGDFRKMVREFLPNAALMRARWCVWRSRSMPSIAVMRPTQSCRGGELSTECNRNAR
jgi:hypothetical protein